MSIFTRQNEEKNIDLLCAQKQLYKEAKVMFMWQIILTCPVIVLLSALKLVLSLWAIDITGCVILYSTAITIFDVLLILLSINDIKKKAAKAQEEFDCSVYNLEWNKNFVGKRNGQDVTTKYSRKFKADGGNVAKLIDWYPVELAKFPHLKAVLHCQKTNLVYDTEVRNRFKKKALIVAIVPVLLLFFISAIINSAMNNLLVLLAVLLPVIVLAIKIYLDQNKVINYSEETKSIIDSLLNNASNLDVNDIRDVQKRIYTNRKDSALIPDFFYEKIRDQLEKEMHENAAKSE
jgi:hypothetical protein